MVLRIRTSVGCGRHGFHAVHRNIAHRNRVNRIAQILQINGIHQIVALRDIFRFHINHARFGIRFRLVGDFHLGNSGIYIVFPFHFQPIPPRLYFQIGVFAHVTNHTVTGVLVVSVLQILAAHNKESRQHPCDMYQIFFHNHIVYSAFTNTSNSLNVTYSWPFNSTYSNRRSLPSNVSSTTKTRY